MLAAAGHIAQRLPVAELHHSMPATNPHQTAAAGCSPPLAAARRPPPAAPPPPRRRCRPPRSTAARRRRRCWHAARPRCRAAAGPWRSLKRRRWSLPPSACRLPGARVCRACLGRRWENSRQIKRGSSGWGRSWLASIAAGSMLQAGGWGRVCRAGCSKASMQSARRQRQGRSWLAAVGSRWPEERQARHPTDPAAPCSFTSSPCVLQC